MRYFHGTPPDITHQSIDSFALMEHAINDADVLPNVFELYANRETPMSALLSRKGMKTKGLFEGYRSNSYRVVSSNKVHYAIKASDRRKSRIISVSGATHVCDAYPSEPGKYQSIVYLYLDNNWAGPREVLEFNDNVTQAYIIDEVPPQEVAGGFRYTVRLVTTEREDFFPSDVLEAGSEVSAVSTLDAHDFSETGIEKYTFNSWGTAYMSLQRHKYSYSGTAQAMSSNDRRWVEHKGNLGFLEYANDEMLKRAGEYHEYWSVFGKGTVNVEDGTTLLKNIRGQEVMAGQGVMYQGDGAYEYPFNDLTIKHIEGIMDDVDVRSGDDSGVLEVMMLCGNKYMAEFSRKMRAAGYVNQNNNVEGSGADKGVNNTYSYYEFNGVRIYPIRWRWLDGVDRPTKYFSDGTAKSAWDAIFVPLGKTAGGDNSIELVQLRPAVTGSVDGMNVGGKMATSVDGGSNHLLIQTGIISRAKISRSFRK